MARQYDLYGIWHDNGACGQEGRVPRVHKQKADNQATGWSDPEGQKAGNRAIPFGRLNSAPRFPPHFYVRYGLEETHVEYLALVCCEESVSLSDLEGVSRRSL